MYIYYIGSLFGLLLFLGETLEPGRLLKRVKALAHGASERLHFQNRVSVEHLFGLVYTHITAILRDV